MSDHVHDLCPYPTTLGDAVPVVIDYLRGRSETSAHLIHAAWHVAGYALGKALPSGLTPIGSPLPADKAALAEQLEAMAAAESDPAGVVGSPAWVPVAFLLLELAAKWLRERR